MTPTHEKRTLLTVITEAAVEEPLLRDLDKLGISGYTVTDARGRGSRGIRDAAWKEAAKSALKDDKEPLPFLYEIIAKH